MTTWNTQNIDGFREELSKWNGCNAVISSVRGISHPELNIALYRDRLGSSLQVICVHPTYHRGPIEWLNAHVEIVELRADDFIQDVQEYSIIDRGADVEVRCLTLEARGL